MRPFHGTLFIVLLSIISQIASSISAHGFCFYFVPVSVLITLFPRIIDILFVFFRKVIETFQVVSGLVRLCFRLFQLGFNGVCHP